VTYDRDLFGRAQKAAAADAKAKARAAAAQAKAAPDRTRQEREQFVRTAIDVSRHVLQVNSDPDWQASGPDFVGVFAEATIAGLYWKYYSDDVLFVPHPNPPCGHNKGKRLSVKNLVELGALFDKNGKPINSAWAAVKCLQCNPPPPPIEIPPGSW
jgi:hypothetical protein